MDLIFSQSGEIPPKLYCRMQQHYLGISASNLVLKAFHHFIVFMIGLLDPSASLTWQTGPVRAFVASTTVPFPPFHALSTFPTMPRILEKLVLVASL